MFVCHTQYVTLLGMTDPKKKKKWKRVRKEFADGSGSATFTIDPETGEILTEGKDWFKFVNVTYTMVARDTFRILRQERLPMDATMIMYWCWDRVRRGNEIDASYSEIGADLAGPDGKPRSRQRVCEMFRELERLNLLKRYPKKILLNPYYQFRGTATAHRVACEEWDELNHIPVNPPAMNFVVQAAS
jgi:hypothetical protein